MRTVEAVSAGLYIAAYLLAVVDGTLQDKGTYPSGRGRTGFRLYFRQHPWIVAGAACGVLGTVAALL
jgi:hypothetical protein